MSDIIKKKSNTIILIPSRLESSRLKNKPLKLINGIPMIVHVAMRAEKLGIGDVFVASGNKKISNILEKFKIKSVITSPDHKSGTDRIYEAFSHFNKKNYQYIVNLQGDLPLFHDCLIPNTIKILDDKSVDIASAICELKKKEFNDSNIVKAIVKLKEDNSGFSTDFRRKINNSTDCFHHIGIYVFRPETLKKFVNLKSSVLEKKRNLEQMRALENGMRIKLVKVKDSPLSVDTPKDLKKIRYLFKKSV